MASTTFLGILRDLERPLIRSVSACNASIKLAPQLGLHRIDATSVPANCPGRVWSKDTLLYLYVKRTLSQNRVEI